MNMRIVLLNAVLVLVLATLVFQFRRGLLDYEATHDVSSIQAEAEIDISIAGIEGLERGSERSDWNLVSVLNPFSADRNDIAVLGLAPASEAVDMGGPVTSVPALIGTLLLGDERVALMASPEDLAYVSLRVGETIGGWQLVEIDRKSVVVEATGGRRDVVMNDPTMSVSGARTRGRPSPEHRCRKPAFPHLCPPFPQRERRLKRHRPKSAFINRHSVQCQFLVNRNEPYETSQKRRHDSFRPHPSPVPRSWPGPGVAGPFQEQAPGGNDLSPGSTRSGRCGHLPGHSRSSADALGLNYVIDPRVQGTVNINTSETLQRSDLLPILETILKINNASMVLTGNYYEILPADTAVRAPLEVRSVVAAVSPDDRMVIQVIHLRFVSASEMATLLGPYLGEGASIAVHAGGNVLMVTDRESNLRKIMEVIDIFDAAVFENERVRMIPVQNARVADVVNDLQSVFSGYSLSGGTGGRRRGALCAARTAEFRFW